MSLGAQSVQFLRTLPPRDEIYLISAVPNGRIGGTIMSPVRSDPGVLKCAGTVRRRMGPYASRWNGWAEAIGAAFT